jgi:hypothetical protein
MTAPDRNANGRARPVRAGLALGAPGRPQRKNLPHDRPLWLRPEDEIFFIAVCCEPRGKISSAIRILGAQFLILSNFGIGTLFGTPTWSA